MTVETSLGEGAEKMQKAIAHLKEDLATIRTGRAAPALLNRVTVEYYGSPVPLNQLASIAVPGAAAPHDHAVRQDVDPRGREGHPGERHRRDARRTTAT